MGKIDDLIKAGNYEALRSELSKKTGVTINVKYEDCAKQYDVTKHTVMDTTSRADKITTSGVVKVSRLPVAYQELIVDRAVAILMGYGVKINATSENDNQKTIIQMVQAIWDNCKLDYKNKKIARTLFSECEVAELWYFIEDESMWAKFKKLIGVGGKLTVRMRVLANSLGDTLYPYFDETGNMTAFGRQYSITNGDKSELCFDVYSDSKILMFRDGKLITNKDNILSKIPVIYYSQPAPLWSKVQNIIERYEKTISNFPDTNDYFGSPTLIVNGEVKSLAEKDSSGKVVKLENDAKAAYLTWDQAPESIRLELETEERLIYTTTQTPDISFAQMKGIGNVSGVGLELLFMDAHLKASNNEELIGEGIQRRLNLLKAAVGKIAVKLESEVDNITIKPAFEYFIPKDDKTKIDTLVSATGGKPVMSQKRATELNPFVVDPAAEYGQIKDEETASIASQSQGTANY